MNRQPPVSEDHVILKQQATECYANIWNVEGGSRYECLQDEFSDWEAHVLWTNILSGDISEFS